MKTYNVELKRTSYITVTVQADTEDEAEERAWLDLAENRNWIEDADWQLESVEEVQL
jgi:hypothetical protein